MGQTILAVDDDVKEMVREISKREERPIKTVVRRIVKAEYEKEIKTG